MKKLLLKIWFISIFVLISSANFAQTIKWYSFNEGLEKSKRESKYLLVDFYTDWCGWCKKMDSVAYTDGKVVSYLNKNFVAVKINAEGKDSLSYDGEVYTNSEFAKAAEVKSYPATTFFLPTGDFIATMPGYMEADEFLELLTYIILNKIETMGFKDYQLMNKINVILKKDTGNAELLFALGYIYQKILNDSVKAEKYYNKAIAINSSFVETYVCLSELETAKGNLSIADKWMQLAKDYGYDDKINVENKVRIILQKYIK